jgi:hypothetical protein
MPRHWTAPTPEERALAAKEHAEDERHAARLRGIAEQIRNRARARRENSLDAPASREARSAAMK